MHMKTIFLHFLLGSLPYFTLHPSIIFEREGFAPLALSLTVPRMLDIYEQCKVRTCDSHGGFPRTMPPLSGKGLLFTFNWLCFFKTQGLLPLTLFWTGGGGKFAPPSWFFEYSSETIRSRKLKLCDF